MPMESVTLSRAYLETLSSADLLQLADEYGIDVPDDLNRRFIIGELLEVAEDFQQRPENSDMKEASAPEVHSERLPFSYNETEIDVVLRNPAWAYVWWDISDAMLKKFSSNGKFQNLVLRLSYFDSADSNSPVESFDIQISMEDREKFVLISAGKKYFRIDLVAVLKGKETDNVAVSRKIAVPKENTLALKALPGRDLNFSDIHLLSGVERVLRSHYNNYRQSFAE